MVTKGFIGKPVEFLRFYVLLDLAIPSSCIERSEPPPKLSEFLSRETGDSLLEGFEFTHKKKRYHHLLSSRGNASPLSSRPRVPVAIIFQLQIVSRTVKSLCPKLCPAVPKIVPLLVPASSRKSAQLWSASGSRWA